MSGDPVMTQLSCPDTLGMANGSLPPPPLHPRPVHESSSSKSDSGHKGGRSQGRDGLNQRLAHSNPNHRISNSRSKNGYSSNQQKNHSPNSGGNYSRNDYSVQNNIMNASQQSYHPSMALSLPVQHRHMGNSGGMVSNMQHSHSSPHISQMETFTHRPATGMTYSSSNESELPESVNDNIRGVHSFSNIGIRSESNYNGPTYFSNHQMRANQSGSRQYEENNRGLLTNSEMPLHQQHALAMPWAYTSSPMVPAMITPPSVHSPHVTYEHQANFEADLSRSSTSPMQSPAPQMSVGAHNSQEQGRDNLREQLEWYFSARNLATDTYLVSKMTADHWVPIAVIAEFNKVKQITNSIQDIVDALRRSSKVTVDETGTMVKAIEVDRPRTTLILRDLSEDTKEEEIEAFFKGANCPAKSITREVVGNMWFVEFTTAEDAMAMLLYTRGRQIRNVPIAARLKSNTVLTGPEFRAAHSSPTTQGNPNTMFFPTRGWMPSPPSPSFDPSMMGMPMPYRRFPTDEGLIAQDTWTPAQEYPPHAIPHRHSVSHGYPSGGYFPLLAPGVSSQRTPPQGYGNQPQFEYERHGSNRQYARRRQDRQQYKNGTETGFRRNSDSGLRSFAGRTMGEVVATRKGEQSRRNKHDSSRLHSAYPRECSNQFSRKNTSGTTMSETSSLGAPMTKKYNKKHRKQSIKQKDAEAHHRDDRRAEEGNKQSGDTVDTTSVYHMDVHTRRQEAYEKTEPSQHGQVNQVSATLSKLTIEDQAKAAMGRQRSGSSASRTSKVEQASEMLASEGFPPLPSHTNAAQCELPGAKVIRPVSQCQSSTMWVPHVIKSNTHAQANAIEASHAKAANEVSNAIKEERQSAHQSERSTKVPGMRSPRAGTTDVRQQTKEYISFVRQDPLEQESKWVSAPIVGMVTSTDDSPIDDRARGTGEKHATATANNSSGVFSYASALKIQHR
ncbi:hypothetical protein BGZ50_007871 [Haplosporangium sp. Z 11]|nr:hypothetical protein BGZ50_007871 [Haplosporangium sp. Z 11]